MRFYNKYLDMATLYEKCALFSQKIEYRTAEECEILLTARIKPWWSISDFRTLVRENLKIPESQVSQSRVLIIFYLSSRIRKQLTGMSFLKIVDFQGKSEYEMGQQIQRLIHQDQRDGHIDTFCLDLPRFYEALVRLGHAVCATFQVNLIHEQFSFLMIHYAIRNGKVESNMALTSYGAKMWTDPAPHFELDDRVISNVYRDFKVNLLDNQLDERLTNGRIDLTGILNYLVKARVLDTHKINRERQDPSNRYTLRSLIEIATSQEELTELLRQGISLSELEKTDIFQIMLLAMHGREALIRRQSRRRDERDFALDLGQFRRFIELLVLKMSLSLRDYTPPRYPLQRAADFLMFKIHY